MFGSANKITQRTGNLTDCTGTNCNKAPNSVSATYTHPAEFATTNMLPLLFAMAAAARSHVALSLAFVVFRVVQTSEAHSGYKVGIMNQLEYYSGGFVTAARTHDMHHEKTTCNYGSQICVVDWLCGTHRPARELVQSAKHSESSQDDSNHFH